MKKIKKILVEQLKVGMYISDLDEGYMDHPFILSRFQVKDDGVIRKLIDAGIRAVYIDTSKGLDVPDAPSYSDILKNLKNEMDKIADDKKNGEDKVKVSIYDELDSAQKTYNEAGRIIRYIIDDVSKGRRISEDKAKLSVAKISESITKCQDALLLLCSSKNKNDHIFQHSISVCSLVVAFCNSLGFDEQSVNSAGLGGLLLDVGKAKIDNKIINKTLKLTEKEFNILKEHVAEGRKIIDQIPDMPEISKQVICEHHENYDGSGYPKGLKGDEISKFGRIAAICDVYDAITSDRLYRKGLIPNKALSKIFEWRGSKFDRLLVEQFIHTIGIYPTGSFVMLESGRVALVIQQNGKSLLTPIIKVFYDSIIKKYVKPVEVDLSEGFSDRIADAVSPLKLKLDINPMDILLTL